MTQMQVNPVMTDQLLKFLVRTINGIFWNSLQFIVTNIVEYSNTTATVINTAIPETVYSSYHFTFSNTILYFCFNWKDMLGLTVKIKNKSVCLESHKKLSGSVARPNRPFSRQTC